ncbi:MAG: hypothetical protein E6R03_07405 [Hyphomicrobiaceae bacterium]|nr:MAG: hypothetical protein E6R03_07405 [Hyphomicrobiaceae bacterium]
MSLLSQAKAFGFPDAFNLSTVKPVLAINAASAATVKTTSAMTLVIGGVMYTKAALAAQVLTNAVGPAGLGVYVQPVSTTVYYTIGVNAAGTVKVYQGSYLNQPLGAPTPGVYGDGLVPDVETGYAAIGGIKIVTNGATTFTLGTTALDAAGVTATYADFCGPLPSSF